MAYYSTWLRVNHKSMTYNLAHLTACQTWPSPSTRCTIPSLYLRPRSSWSVKTITRGQHILLLYPVLAVALVTWGSRWRVFLCGYTRSRGGNVPMTRSTTHLSERATSTLTLATSDKARGWHIDRSGPRFGREQCEHRRWRRRKFERSERTVSRRHGYVVSEYDGCVVSKVGVKFVEWRVRGGITERKQQF